ncbi:MAG: sucrase ferredoxin [Anaerolineae bacterium]|jgi:hypothetical protein|nr:sucrase ferredoxin [Anaerolineae bacterium]
METEQVTVKTYCNVLALEKGLDPVGYANAFDTLILMEARLPWKKEMYMEAGTLPQEVIDLIQVNLKRYQETGIVPTTRPLVIAPDEEYSREGYRRVILFERQGACIAQFTRSEYLMPEADMGALIWALAEQRDRVAQFDAFRVEVKPAVRDLLVCTHGTVDAACAKFGYPLYNGLRQHHANDSLRVWRVSHFGGHVFAPTMMDMPTGHYWAYVEAPQSHQIVRQTGDVTALRGHYRGWAGLSNSFMQAAERELWQQYGWDWFHYPKTGTITSQDPSTDHPLWAEVQITFEQPDGVIRTAQGRVEVQRHIETITTTGNDHTYNYPQYQVTHLELLA